MGWGPSPAGGGGGGVQIALKGPFRFTFEDYAELVTGVDLWNTVAGDSPVSITLSVPVTPFDGGTAATVLADSAPTLPLTIVASVNDTFVFTGDGGGGSPETFTLAPGVYTTIAEVVTAMGAALGESTEAFSTLVTPSNDSGSILLTMVSGTTGGNGNTLSGGDGGAAALGFTGNPDVFAGGANSSVELLLGGDVIGSPADISVIDPSMSSPTPFREPTSSILDWAGGAGYYVPTSGVPYTLKWVAETQPPTQGEMYVYGLILPAFYRVT
jgi:hypothetical protein